ncbi:hypothetical protein E3U55_02390 [Filobacillus milosensis]|uniref:DUF8042 domain-containing protein n=1 Tax=Filobacillus milosensis TaxID=94137 RepID=A0A4Y8IU60_9BACI|nr:hypothetical protein [Filobacillus milosensis]TFB24370.1 hypothetical protein E3U55_02390 [Filobacillus milosensis]
MTEVKEETIELMKKYLTMLQGVDEALQYISINTDIEGSAFPQVPQIFEDTLEALQQMNSAHEIFQKEIDVKTEAQEFDEFVQILSYWNQMQTNSEKQQLIQDQAFPKFNVFKKHIEKRLNEYVMH